MAVAIDTDNVISKVNKNNVVRLVADLSDESEEINRVLVGLGANSIPLVAIYPGTKPDTVILLPDKLSETQVLAALKQAGPSVDTPSDTAVVEASGRE